MTDAPDLLNTTIKAKELDRIAHDLGRGDGADLISAGLRAKSNAAESVVNERHQRREKEKALQTALELTLQNEAYRQRYEAVWQKLDEAQAAFDEAILENADHIAALEDKAMQTANGRMIFQTDDGFVYADGAAVAAQDQPNPSDISKDATRWEDYKKATERREDLIRIETDTLDPIRTRMNDPDNPPTKTELDDFDKRLDAAKNGINDAPQNDAERAVHREQDLTAQVSESYLFPSPAG